MFNMSSYSESFRSLHRLGAPLVVGHFAHMAIGVTDSLMLGWFSVEALAATVLGHTIFFVIFIVGAGFAAAVMPVVASAIAQGDSIQARRVMRMGLWLSAAYTITVLPIFWWSEALLLAIGQSPDLSMLASRYLVIVGFVVFPALALNVIKSYLSAQELMRFVLVITIVGFLFNIPLNYLLIFGKFGVPELGIQGSAIASFFVNSFMAVSVCIYAVKKLPEQALFLHIWRPDWSAMRKVLRLGVPIGITSLAEAGLFSASTIMMGWLGTVALAAHGIALHITSLTFVIHVGLSGAATIQTGQAFGASNVLSLKRSAFSASLASLIVVVMTVILFLSMPKVLVSLFIDPASPHFQDILTYGALLLFMAALFSTVDAAQVMALGILRGMQDTSIPMSMAIFSYWGVGIPIAYWFCFVLNWGGVGLWAGLALGLACAAGGLIARFFWVYNRLRKTSPMASSV
ncbi:MAG: MATE family efflux transporter [Paracoccaceae bacterium]|nr:MATE family efflux transporter [Paracoccaceae bacterium]